MKKMLVVKLTDAGEAIRTRQNFRASNLMGLSVPDEFGKAYEIISYATVIYREDGAGFTCINRLNESFSRSTSRHQSIVRRALNIKQK